MEKKTERTLIKIGELVKRSGVNKETIRFYINSGLLPKPVKTGKNMAYYDEGYVERIRQIKELQLKYFLPLKVIREMVGQTDMRMNMTELDMLRVGAEGMMQLQKLRRTYDPQTIEEVSRRAGLPIDEIMEMEECEMISSVTDENGRRVYEENDIRVVEAFAGIRKGGMTRELGFEVNQFRMQSDVISSLAREEVKDFVRKLTSRYPKDIEMLGKMAENAIETVNVFIMHLRRKKIMEIVDELTKHGADMIMELPEEKPDTGEKKTRARGK